MTNEFDHLKDLVLEDTGEKKKRETKEDQIKNMKGLTLRMYHSGEVYPSKELIDYFNLEYLGRHNEHVSYGLDVIDSSNWAPFKNKPRTVFIGAVPKSQPKVDLFASTRYNELGNPISSVQLQGTRCYVLKDIAKTVEGWHAKEEGEYTEFRVNVDYPVKMKDGIAFIPKVMERGKDKGTKSYERRENVTFYPLSLVEQTDQTVTTDAERTVLNEETLILNTSE